MTPELAGAKHPTVVLLRRDWEFLFGQLKSTRAICDYLERVSGEALPLGEEPARYHQLALADESADPDPIDEALLELTGTTVSTPLLPLSPIPSSGPEDELIRWILEDVAESPMADNLEADRIKMLAEIDRLPGAYRSRVGKILIEALDKAAAVPTGHTEWRFHSYRGGRSMVHLGFGVCSSESTAMYRDYFHSWLWLRHYDVRRISGADITSVGVLLSPRSDGIRPWDTSVAAVSGSVEYEPDELRLLRKLWPLASAAR